MTPPTMKPWIAQDQAVPLNESTTRDLAPMTTNDPRTSMCPAGLHGLVAPQRVVMETKNGTFYTYTLSEDKPNPKIQVNPDGRALASLLRLFSTTIDPKTGKEKDHRLDVEDMQFALVPGMEAMRDKIKELGEEAEKRHAAIEKKVKQGELTEEEGQAAFKEWILQKSQGIEGYTEAKKKFRQILSGADLPAGDEMIQVIAGGHSAHGFSLCYLPEDEKSTAQDVKSLRWYLSLYDARDDMKCAATGDTQTPPLYDVNDPTGRATVKLPQSRWFTFAAEAGLASPEVNEKGGEWCLTKAGERDKNGLELYEMHVRQQIQENSRRAKGIGMVLSGRPMDDFKYEMDVTLNPASQYFTRFLSQDEAKVLAPSWVTFLEPLLFQKAELKAGQEAREVQVGGVKTGSWVGIASVLGMGVLGYGQYLMYKLMKKQMGGENIKPEDYSDDLTNKAKEAGFSHLVGMEDIQAKMDEATLDPDMPHIVRSGAAGSGKSESVHEFFHRVATGQIPHLEGYRLWSISGNALEAAGAKWAGLPAKVLQKFLDAAQKKPTIIWVQEAHQLLKIGTHSGNQDSGAIERLKEILVKRGSNILFIFDTNMPEKLYEDEAFGRRATEVANREYKYEEALAAVKGKAQRYEGEHKVKISAEAIEVATRLGAYKPGAVPSSQITIVRMATRRARYRQLQNGGVAKVEVTKADVIALIADDLGSSPEDVTKLFEQAQKHNRFLKAAEVKAGRIIHDEKELAAKESAVQEEREAERSPERVLDSLDPLIRHAFADGTLPEYMPRLQAVMLLMESGLDISEVKERVVSLLKDAQAYARSQKKPQKVTQLDVAMVWEKWQAADHERQDRRMAVRHFLDTHSAPEVRAYWEARGGASRDIIIEDAMAALGESSMTQEALETKLNDFAQELIRQAPMEVEAACKLDEAEESKPAADKGGNGTEAPQRVGNGNGNGNAHRAELAFAEIASYQPDINGLRAVLEHHQLGEVFEADGLHGALTLDAMIKTAARGDSQSEAELRSQVRTWQQQISFENPDLTTAETGPQVTARFLAHHLVGRAGPIVQGLQAADLEGQLEHALRTGGSERAEESGREADRAGQIEKETRRALEAQEKARRPRIRMYH